jgi:hypothetical protein
VWLSFHISTSTLLQIRRLHVHITSGSPMCGGNVDVDMWKDNHTNISWSSADTQLYWLHLYWLYLVQLFWYWYCFFCNCLTVDTTARSTVLFRVFSKSKSRYDWQSVSISWCQVHSASSLGFRVFFVVHYIYNVEANPTEIVVCVVTYCWLPWNEINKLLHSNWHLLNVAHVGGSHNIFSVGFMPGKLINKPVSRDI